MLTNQEIAEALCAPGQFFEIETIEISGVSTRAWTNAPVTLRAALGTGAGGALDRDFLVDGSERLSHSAHLELADAFGAALVEELGLVKGDRVAIAMRNRPEWSIAFFGATSVGAVAVPVNAFGTGADLAHAIVDSDAKVVVADGERLERLSAESAALKGRTVLSVQPEDRRGTGPLPSGLVPFSDLVVARPRVEVAVAPDDLATIFYTSGTTSLPKGVLGTHRNICSTLVSMAFTGVRNTMRDTSPPSEAPTAPPVQLLTVPLFHATGCHSMLVSSAFFGGTLVLMRKWDPDVALDIMEQEKVTAFAGVPTMIFDVLNSPSIDRRDLSSIRNIGGGGSASPPELLRQIKDRFPDAGAGTGYGLTESSSLTTSIGGADYREHPASVGAPVPVCELRIVAPDGTDVAPGETGEVWIKGPNVVPGYWNQPEATEQTFTDGWLRTGDIGRLDDEGLLYIVDRAKDIVIRGGENISTLEVEAALMDHPAVKEAAVFSIPHPTLGEEVGAAVHLRKNSTTSPEEIRSHLAGALAPHKVPARIWISEEPLPRGDTGKMLKRAVQDAYAATTEP